MANIIIYFPEETKKEFDFHLDRFDSKQAMLEAVADNIIKGGPGEKVEKSKYFKEQFRLTDEKRDALKKIARQRGVTVKDLFVDYFD